MKRSDCLERIRQIRQGRRWHGFCHRAETINAVGGLAPGLCPASPTPICAGQFCWAPSLALSCRCRRVGRRTDPDKRISMVPATGFAQIDGANTFPRMGSHWRCRPTLIVDPRQAGKSVSRVSSPRNGAVTHGKSSSRRRAFARALTLWPGGLRRSDARRRTRASDVQPARASTTGRTGMGASMGADLTLHAPTSPSIRPARGNLDRPGRAPRPAKERTLSVFVRTDPGAISAQRDPTHAGAGDA